MPNQYGQLTREDDKAPEGMFRIRQEDLTDGDLEVVGDFYRLGLAEHVTRLLRRHEECTGNIYAYLLFNDRGEVIY